MRGLLGFIIGGAAGYFIADFLASQNAKKNRSVKSSYPFRHIPKAPTGPVLLNPSFPGIINNGTIPITYPEMLTENGYPSGFYPNPF
jgi:hypothetical protein